MIEAAQCRLPLAEEQRLRRLISRSERGTLTRKELEEYRAVAQRCEQVSLVRLQALTELARLHGKPVSEVMEEIVWQGTNDEV